MLHKKPTEAKKTREKNCPEKKIVVKAEFEKQYARDEQYCLVH